MEEMNLMNYVVILYREGGETIIPFRKIISIDSFNEEINSPIKVVVLIDDGDDMSCKKIGTHYEIITIEEIVKRNNNK